MADEAKTDVWNTFSKRYEVTDPKAEMPGSGFKEPKKKTHFGKVKKKLHSRNPASKLAVQYHDSIRRPRPRKAEVKYELPKCDDCGQTIQHHRLCATKHVNLEPKKTVRWVWE